ncbi:MAG TPA: DUF6691 family protein [Kiloniellales bacterium]|nr:DUF6691 family protein [Kiloniellales bacterium]
MKDLILGLLLGGLFGFGLALSGMTDPAVVLGFLDPLGAWNQALAFVMAGALAVTFLLYRLARVRPAPLAAASFHWPTATVVDARLIGGAALFGVGWGLAGYCPGPALASLSASHGGTLVFVCAMLAGMVIVRAISQPRANLHPAVR